MFQDTVLNHFLVSNPIQSLTKLASFFLVTFNQSSRTVLPSTFPNYHPNQLATHKREFPCHNQDTIDVTLYDVPNQHMPAAPLPATIKPDRSTGSICVSILDFWPTRPVLLFDRRTIILKASLNSESTFGEIRIV